MVRRGQKLAGAALARALLALPPVASLPAPATYSITIPLRCRARRCRAWRRRRAARTARLASTAATRRCTTSPSAAASAGSTSARSASVFLVKWIVGSLSAESRAQGAAPGARRARWAPGARGPRAGWSWAAVRPRTAPSARCVTRSPDATHTPSLGGLAGYARNRSSFPHA